MRALIILACMALTGCEGQHPQRVDTSSNPDYQVKFLFEHDGCRAYKFSDEWENHYYIVCQSGTSVSTQWEHHHGKVRVRHETYTSGGVSK